MHPALLILLLTAALNRPVRPCLLVGLGPDCGCLETFGGAYVPGPSGLSPKGERYVRPCDAAQLAYLQRWLPLTSGGAVRQ